MATVQRSVATLRVMGDSLQPELITQVLGCEPTSAQRKGDDLTGKSGASRVARFGMWRLEAAAREPADLNEQVSEILAKLTQDLEVWRSVTAAHTTDLFCGLFMDRRNEGLELSSTSMAALGSRGILLGLDIYSGDDERDA
jgi:hypothetical protein